MTHIFLYLCKAIGPFPFFEMFLIHEPFSYCNNLNKIISFKIKCYLSKDMESTSAGAKALKQEHTWSI